MPGFAVAADRSDAQDAADFAPGVAAAPVPWYSAVSAGLENGYANQRLGGRDDAVDTAFLQRHMDVERRLGRKFSFAPAPDSADVNPDVLVNAFEAGGGDEANIEGFRQKFPQAMAGVPTADQVRAQVASDLDALNRKAGISAGQHPIAGFVGSAGAQLLDPVNTGVGSAAGPASEGLPLIGRVLVQSGVWGSLAGLEAPAKAEEAGRVGGPAYGMPEALGDVGGGLLAGPIFEGGGAVLKALGGRLFGPALARVLAGHDEARGALMAADRAGRDMQAVGPARDGGDYEAGVSSLADGAPPPPIEPAQDLGDLFGTPAPASPDRVVQPTLADSPAGAALYERSEYRGRPIFGGTFDPAQVGVAPETFQYKSGADAQGLTERLRGVQAWDPTSSGKVIIYQGRDGALTIADGHQRLGLARRMEAKGFEPRLDGYLFRQADGWSPTDVRIIAALKNIREGQGAPLDAAKVFRDAPAAINDDSLPVSGDFIAQAKGLARLSPEAFGAVVNKVIPERYAAQIGQLAGDRPELHEGMVRLLKAGDPANLDEAHAMIQEAKLDAWIKGQGEQSDLFGDTPAQSLAIGRAKLRASLMRSLRSDARLFSQLVRHADAIEAGGNTLARTSNEAELAANNAALEVISKLGMRAGEIGDAMTAAAEKITAGAKVADAARPILTRIKKALATGERLDIGRAVILDPAPSSPAAEAHAAEFTEVGGAGQEAQIAPKGEDAELEAPAPPAADHAADIDKVIAAAAGPGHAPQKAELGPVTPWLAQAARENGLEIEGFTHTIDGSALRHIMTEHGDVAGEAARGQIAVTAADLHAIPDIVAHPDFVAFGDKGKRGLDQVWFAKQLGDGSMLLVEEARTGRKNLALVSMRKYPAAIDEQRLGRLVDLNAPGDGGDGLKIVRPPENATAAPAAPEAQHPGLFDDLADDAPHDRAIDHLKTCTPE